MFDCLEKKATQTGFAKLVGTTKQAVSDRFNGGQLPPDGTYAEWLAAYLSRLREEAAGRSDKDLASARARETLASAQLKEIELSEKLSLVVMVSDLAPALVVLMKDTRSSMMEAGNKILQSIESETGTPFPDEFVLNPIRSALSSAAGGADQLVSSIAGKPGTPVSSTLTAPDGVDRRKHKAAS